MTIVYIPRILVVGEKSFTEEQLLREGTLFVVLAEPGAGKTELLKVLAGLLHTVPVRASILRNRTQDSASGPLVIDAMDEVARIDTLATDKIVVQTSQTAAATVVFAGRSSEWDQSRTAYVEQCFGVKPIVVRLQPFNEDEQRQLFAAAFPGEDFDAFSDEVRKCELGPLLGNPQFLQLLGEAYVESNRTFNSKAKIFADAIQRLAHEANPDLGRQKARPPTSKVVALGGEVFAKLMMSGATGTATVESLSDRDFPYINGLCRNSPEAGFLIDTRLMKPSHDSDKHEPNHRIVAEYCAAAYLVARIEDPADRLSLDRVFSIIGPNHVARDELRGMLGWMAALGREPLQFAAIRLDPYAVLANGDPTQLTAPAKRLLLSALEELAEDDPMFRRSDVWRRFNVGHFFSADILDQVRAVLAKPSALRSLVLELLIGAKAASSLVPELRALMKGPGVDGNTRKLTLEVLLSAAAYDPSGDFAGLLADGSPTALEFASRAVAKKGGAAVGVSNVSTLLGKLASLYPQPSRRHRDGMSRYFINVLIRSFGLADVMTFLDNLSEDLTCTCSPKHEFLCTCRHGKSRVIGKLLDRYFELAPNGHDPVRVWPWIKELHFQSSVSGNRSPSVKYLGEHHYLRKSLQQLALDGVTGEEAAHKAVSALFSSHVHSGLCFHEGDPQSLGQYALDNGLVDLWAAFISGHDIYSATKEPNPVRALQRIQSRTSRESLAAWYRREKGRREYIKSERRSHFRNRKKFARREAEIKESNRTHLRENLSKIEAGDHWGWVKQFAQGYLLQPEELDDLVDDPETPLRALRNCFPSIKSHIPTVEALGRGQGQTIAEVLLAACVVRFRDSESLDAIDPAGLAAAKTEMSSYPTFAKDEAKAFEDALDAALFKSSDAAEAFVRTYLEQQLSATDDTPTRVEWLDNKSAFQHLRATLPLEWLARFPQMPLDAARSLFGMAAKYGDKEELAELIDRRATDSVSDSGQDAPEDKRARARNKFWQLNAFFYKTPGCDAAWHDLKADRDTIFALDHRLGRLYAHDGDPRPSVTAEQVYKIMDAFVDVWPKVPLPSTWGTGDPPKETAYRFICDCIWKIAEDAPDRRVPVLERIIGEPRLADFRNVALTLRAEANRQIALQDFRAPLPEEINRLLDENEVATVEDLRALLVEELGEVQKWLHGSETDPLDTFYTGGKRVDENTARNRIVDRLNGRMTALGLSVVIEHHMAGGNRCDFTASATIEGARRMLVTEVKGQWNRELFTAAAAQLDQRYAIHPDAAKQGIYLALWYGNGEKVAGLSDPVITSASDLKNRIVASMPDELRGRVDVVVVDLSRTPPSPKPRKSSAGKRSRSSNAPRKPRPKAKALSSHSAIHRAVFGLGAAQREHNQAASVLRADIRADASSDEETHAVQRQSWMLVRSHNHDRERGDRSTRNHFGDNSLALSVQLPHHRANQRPSDNRKVVSDC